MKLFYSLVITSVLLMSTNSKGTDINNGNQLHADNCTRCHQDDIYTRVDRKIKNFEQLKKQVQQCELAIELGWFEEEVEDVTAYLNATYYMFGIK